MGLVGSDRLLKRLTGTGLVVALVALAALVGCGVLPRTERVEITETDILGSWAHEFEGGPTATVTLNADGSVTLVDVPRVVFAGSHTPSEPPEVVFDDRITTEGSWSTLQIPTDDRDPSVVVTLSDDANTSTFLGIDNFYGPIQVYFRYGDYEDELTLKFDRVE